MTNSDQLFNQQQFPCCPVTGLPITSKPEWADIPLDSEYSVTFSIVGKAILLITPKGKPSDKGANLLLEKREEIISDTGLSDKKFVELRDYRMLTAVPSKGGRMVLTNYLLREQSRGYLKGFWVFGAPLLIRFMLRSGLRLHKSLIPIDAAKDYKEAIRAALKVLLQNGVDVGSKLYPRIKKDGWSLEIEGYGISFELLGDDILYTSARGKLKESNVDQFFKLNKKVLDESGLTQKGYYYRIVNWERFESSTWKARRMYMEGINEINKKTPCKAAAIFGLNKFMKTLIGLSSPFVSSPVIAASDLQEALQIIERERQRETAAEPAEKTQKRSAKTYTDVQLNDYANEMLQVIGGINWDQEGVLLGNMNEEHPLKPVLDALSIIKLDLDNMLREKEVSQKALHDSEVMYRFLAENASDTIWMMSLEGIFTYHSPSIMKLRGFTPEEANSIGMEQTVTPASVSLLLRMVEEENAKPMAKRWADRIVELEMYHKDGGIIWTEASVRAVRDTDGNVVGLQGSTRDITDRKQAEGKLRESEAQYRLLANNMRDQLWLMDLNLKPTYISPSVAKSRGYTFEEIAQLPMDKHLTAASLQSAMEFFSIHMPKALADPSYFLRHSLELEFYRKDGSTIWLENAFSLIRDESGKPVSLLGVGRDITDRRLAEGKLLESEEKYRNILENIEDGYFEVDLAGNFTFFNASICRILGYSQEEMLGMNNRAYMDPENAKKVLQSFHEIYLTGIPTRGFEWKIIQKKGDRRNLEVSVSLIVNPGEKPTGFRGVARDVTEKKMIEATQQAKQRAEAANKAKGQFLANMSHEIRTPLNGVLGMAEAFLDTELDEEQKHMIGTIIKEANSLLRIINEILDFSKIEAGKIEIEHIPFDLRNLFEDVTESFLNRTAKKGLELISFISPETPTRIMGDPGRLRQILKNLIGNAIKFTHEGRIVVKAEPVHDLGDKIKLRFLVTDTGIGIPKEKQAIVFESFTQADGTTTRKYGGTGLGITISKQLAELMGGEIGLESEEGKGSTFWFTSVFAKQSGTDLQGSREVDLVTRHIKTDADRNDVCILLAEDYPTNQEIAKRHLEHAGYQVDLAENGKLALEAFKRKHYDLILMDIQMPVMDGYQATKAIREIEAQFAADDPETVRRTPIIAMTAHVLREHKELCLEAGMNDFLSKPLTRKELLAITAKWLEVRSMQIGAPALNFPLGNIQGIPPAAIPSGKPIDMERAIDEFEGDRELVAEVITGFIKKVSEQLVTIREAISCGDAEIVRKEAHAIKGGAASLTAGDLAKASAELESKGKSKDLSGAGEIVNRLENEFEALRRYIEEDY